MSRDYRDKRGGHYSGKFYIDDSNHAEFAKQCRRIARHKAKQSLREGEEPEPMYPIERVYFD